MLDDEGFMFQMPPQDLMVARSEELRSLAKQVDETKNRIALDILLHAMDCILFTINPPRGQLHVINGNENDGQNTGN